MTEYNGCHFSVAIAATGQASGTDDDERCIKNITMVMNTTIAQIQKDAIQDGLKIFQKTRKESHIREFTQFHKSVAKCKTTNICYSENCIGQVSTEVY